MSRLEELIEELCPDGVMFEKLEKCCRKIYSGKNKNRSDNGKYKVYGSTGIIGYSESFEYKQDSVLIARVGANCGYVHIATGKYDVSDNTLIVEPNEEVYNIKFVYYQLTNMNLNQYAKGGGQPLVTAGMLKTIMVPVPPLEVQREIVRILDNFTELTAELIAELTGRKKQYEYYKNQLITFDKEIEWKKLSDIALFRNGKGHEKSIVLSGKYIVVNSKFISTNGEVKKFSNEQIAPLFEDDILMVMSDLPNGRALAKCFLVDEDNKYTLNQRVCALKTLDKEIVLTKFLYYYLSRNLQLLQYDNGVDQTNLKKDDILNVQIPIISIEKQKYIIYILEKFETLCSDLFQGLPAEIEARQKQYEYYRDKLLTFKELGAHNV